MSITSAHSSKYTVYIDMRNNQSVQIIFTQKSQIVSIFGIRTTILSFVTFWCADVKTSVQDTWNMRNKFLIQNLTSIGVQM